LFENCYGSFCGFPDFVAVTETFPDFFDVFGSSQKRGLNAPLLSSDR
jgi:hypothetical protein